MDLSIQRDRWWGAQLRLPSWAGYQSRLGPYGTRDKAEPSDGSAALVFAPEGRGPEPLTGQEKLLIRWFEQNEPSVSQAVKAGIIQWCSPQSPERSKFDFGDDFPIIADEKDLAKSVGLYAVNIHQLDVDGVPYIGYEFGCEWEDEHGLGVLMHGTRVVEIGFAHTAFLLWIARNDAERRGPAEPSA